MTEGSYPAGDPLAALRAGDPGPFEAFVASQTPTFLHFFLRQGADRAQAEDLVQEVFLKLFRNAQNYQPQERFSAYAFRVARNAWIDRARRVQTQGEGGGPVEESLSHTVPAELPGPAQVAQDREQAEAIVAALWCLPESQRMVFELGVVQELPYDEIASILGIPLGTVKSRMFHAVRRLREWLESRPGQGR